MKATILFPAIAALAACSTLQPVQSPVTYLESNNPEAVRIYTQRGQFTVLREPRLNGSTITGFDVVEREDVSISVAGIQRMEVKQLNSTRTALLVGAVGVLAGAGIYMATKGNGSRALICDGYVLGQRCVEAPSSSIRVPLLLVPLR